ncbi:hypothetical protein TA3x_003651 [Tundrisphaera sp. TA3]|uniref:hypothetical protein n=1 Tax=Tundrisphaera sp. TA3 TaxID=3435775 RepID=UPI003EB9277D
MLRSHLVGLMTLLLVAGCGGGGPAVPLHPASGTVEVDGKPAAGVMVRLHPADALDDIDRPQPFATTGEDGSFRLGTFEKEDGAPAGSYKVTLFLPDRPLAGPGTPIDLLGDRYTHPARSGLDATIVEGPNQIPPFQVLKVPRPRRAPQPPSSNGID